MNTKLLTLKTIGLFTLSLLIYGCDAKKQYKYLLPDSVNITEVSSVRVPASKYAVYTVDKNAAVSDVNKYPINKWSREGWKVQTWTRQVSGAELLALVDYLTKEKEKYPDDDIYDIVVKDIDVLVDNMSYLHESNALIAYYFKVRPGSKDYEYGYFLYFYYWDIRSGRIIEVTNAFR